MTTVINLFAGPGCGKSTTAAGLFYKLKLENEHKVELVTEYAKELVYEGHSSVLADQPLIYREQQWRVDRLIDKVDFIITDSPAIQGLVYYDKRRPEERKAQLRESMLSKYNSQNNLNFLLPRPEVYNEYGRIQTLDEAIEKDNEIKKLLEELNLPYIQLTKDKTGLVEEVLEYIKKV